ncbi:MAG: RNA methyltransferase [Muribaculaceae bacterium]|nr:RNA methyltransferase [Muribaculaceae bacterium]
MKELSKTKQSLYASLSSRKHRLRHGLFTVEGEKCVADTLASYDIEALIVRSGFEPSMINLGDLPEERVLMTNASGMDKISSLSTSPSVIAVYKLPASALEREPAIERLPENLYLMLDGIQDPGNLGTIVRTAHWFGIKRVFASRDTADIYNPKSIQSTMGSLAKVEVTYCDLAELIDANKEMPVYGLLLDGKNINDVKLGNIGFIIMGNEGKGISLELRKKVTDRLLIPPYNPSDHSESLNVAIATGITLAAFRR